MLSGVKKAHVSSPGLSILFRFIDPDDNYAFYRKESSKKPRLPFLLPYLNTRAGTEDLTSVLPEIFGYVTYPMWRQQTHELAKMESGLLEGFWGILCFTFVWLRCWHLRGLLVHQIQHSDIEKAQQYSHDPQRALPPESFVSSLGRSTVSIFGGDWLFYADLERFIRSCLPY